MTQYKKIIDIGNEFNISTPTIGNWIKTGAIPSPQGKNGYTLEEYNIIISSIKDSMLKLNHRANRSMTQSKLICFCGITNPYRRKQLLTAIDAHNRSGNSIEHSVLALSVIQLQSSSLLKNEWLNYPVSVIERFIANWIKESNFDLQCLNFFSEILDIPNMNDDFIGAFYQSAQSISAKSRTGSFYTPAKLLEDINIPSDKTILDPCCGSGGILLKILSVNHDTSLIYARDTDELALKICRVNLSMFFTNADISANINKVDLIFGNRNETFGFLKNNLQSELFDYIVTNPPWGSKFTNSEKKHILNVYPFLNTCESFSISLYNSIQKLSLESGILIFFLPQSFLNVATHKTIRKYLIQQKYKLKIRNLGNQFSGVMSEVVRLELYPGYNNGIINIISKNGSETEISVKNIFGPNYFIATVSGKNDLNIINKIYFFKHETLEKKAVFALGIVTGNNKKNIFSVKTVTSEPVFRGKDIMPFNFKVPECFIEFSPESYQQVAPIQYYRQKKIIYRFISDRLICAIDTQNRLPLNSANIFIPKIDYPLESIVCLFNSKLYAYIFKKKFCAKKILRSHIESLPLPFISPEQHGRFYEMHERFVRTEFNSRELNDFVYSIFSLNTEEILLVENME